MLLSFQGINSGYVPEPDKASIRHRPFPLNPPSSDQINGPDRPHPSRFFLPVIYCAWTKQNTFQKEGKTMATVAVASPARAIICFSPIRSGLAPAARGRTSIGGVSSRETGSGGLGLGLGLKRLSRKFTGLRAAPTEIEPDLNEDPIDIHRTAGPDEDEFQYGKYDGAHTYHEGHEEKRGFWNLVAEQYNSAEPPTGFQGWISWLFLPAVLASMILYGPTEYMFIGAAVWVSVFCIMEMYKPDRPHNFEPEIYNMERGARDKLIADYNSMDIWDFNEKYGELWDFTLRKDEIVKS